VPFTSPPPAVWDREKETYAEYQARYTAWQQAQQQAQQQREVEQGIAQLEQSSAGATLIASETALLQAGAQRQAEEQARQLAEQQRRAEESRQLAEAQRQADQARADASLQQSLEQHRLRIANEQAARAAAESARQQEAKARANQLLAEATQRLIEETGRHAAPEQEGRVIAEIVQQVSHEGAYARGETDVPPPAVTPSFDYVAAISEGGLSPEQIALFADQRQQQEEYRRAQAEAAAQQQYYEQQTQAAQVLYTQPPAAPATPPSGEGGWSNLSQSPYANWFDVLPADQPPDILSIETGPAESLTPTPSQLPFVLAAIVGGAALIGFAWR